MQTKGSPWHGSLMRYEIEGHRKIAVSERALFMLINDINCQKTAYISDIVRQTALRKDKDYVYDAKRQEIILTISAVQALLIIINTERAWHLYNSLSDLINNKFKFRENS